MRSLVDVMAGLIGQPLEFCSQGDEPKFITTTVHLGDLRYVWPHISEGPGAVSGCGVGLDQAHGMVPALAEALERYCASVYSSDQFISATANELGNDAIDLYSIPRCSRTELLHPRCPLVAPDKGLPIRWVRGISLMNGRTAYLPAVMVYLFAGVKNPAERICLPITTGCAAHISYEQALLGAIFESIERDAISIVWLQQIGLPRIEIDRVEPSLAPFWDSYLRASTELDYVFFDATTDIGVSTVYGLQIARSNDRLRTLVSCCAAAEPALAIAKVIRDMAACRIAFRSNRPTPENYEDFTGVFHGASYMARAERAYAFDFLLKSPGKQLLSEMPTLEGASDDKLVLRVVLDRLKNKGLEVYAVDLSTDECLRSNMRAVRVVIPGLQPLSFHYRARYLGHPRVYDAPRRMGHIVHEEARLNHWPQPFC